MFISIKTKKSPIWWDRMPRPESTRAAILAALSDGKPKTHRELVQVTGLSDAAVWNAEARNPNLRVRPLPLVRGKAKYDMRWYLDLLLEASEELFGLFGYTKEKIMAEKLAMIKQVKLLAPGG
jgi:hypothetical protein